MFAMSISNYARTALAAIVIVGGLGVAVAQPAPSTASTADAGALPPATANLGVSEMRTEASQVLPIMETGAQSVRRQLEQAREARDVVKVLCLNDKLNQIDVALRSGRDRVASLNSWAERNDVERTRHEFTVIQVLRDRARALVQEANQCIGEETGFVGDSKVTVNIDPAIPREDPTLVPQEPIVSVPPLQSSPTR